MKYALLHGVEDLRIEEKPLPEIEDNKVLIKVKACGLCGTDMRAYSGKYPVEFPYSPGHEYSGIVADTGKSVKHVKKGDRVAINPNHNCGYCYFCCRGLPHLCENLKSLKVKSNGGFAEYCLVIENIIHKIPDSVSFKAATLIEPLSCSLHALDEAGIKNGDTVVIIGGGTMGLLNLMLVRNSGVNNIILCEPVEKKREMAKHLGAGVVCNPKNEQMDRKVKEMTGGIGADVIIDNVCSGETIKNALKMVRRKGKIVLSGLAACEIEVSISPFEVTKNEINITGTFLNPYTFERAIKAADNIREELQSLITHEYKLTDINKAIKAFKSEEAIKIVIVPE
ncbi:MAG: zinc-dependent alcohol dehydrogenase family protein [Candidatus Firestonebacteria bacterium]